MRQRINLTSIIFYILISLTIVSCGGGRDGNIRRLKETVSRYLKEDSAANSKELMLRLDSIDKSTENGRKKLYKLSTEFSYHLLSSGNHATAIRFMEEEEGILSSSQDIEEEEMRHLLTLYVRLGAAYDETGMPGIGLDCYSKGLSLTTDTIYDRYRAMLYNNIGVLYNRSSRNDKAEEYFRKALQINLKRKNKKEIFLNYNNLATVFEEEGEIKKAVDASLSGLQYINGEEDPEDFYSTQISLGSLYSRNGELEMARSYLRNGMERLESINFVPGRVDAYTQLAKYYLNSGRLDSAEMYAQKSLTLAKSANLTPLEISSHKLLAEIDSKSGKFQEGLDNLIKGDSLKDALRNDENRLRLKEWEKISNHEKGGKDEENRVRAGWKIAALAGAIVIFALVILGFLITRRSKRSKQGLSEEITSLHKEVDRLNRELTTISIDTMKQHEGIESVSEELNTLFGEMMMKNISQKTRSREIIAKLNHISDNTIDEFKHYFDKVHPDFYRLLEERFPDLTARDIRLCSFLMLGLSTKEIASITYREVRSVESARNRLRKKLGLDGNANILEFLKSLNRGDTTE